MRIAAVRNGKYRDSASFRLLFAEPSSTVCKESFRAGLRRSHLIREPVAGQPISFLEELTDESTKLFQCGKHAAHRRSGAATTTVGLEIVFPKDRRPTRQCFAVCCPDFRHTSNRAHVFGRIVKKLTKAGGLGSNRPERRVPEATATDGAFVVFGHGTVNVSCALALSEAFKKHEQVRTIKEIRRESFKAEFRARASTEKITTGDSLHRADRCKEKRPWKETEASNPEVGEQRRFSTILCSAEPTDKGNGHPTSRGSHHPNSRQERLWPECSMESSGTPSQRQHQEKQQNLLKELVTNDAWRGCVYESPWMGSRSCLEWLGPNAKSKKGSANSPSRADGDQETRCVAPSGLRPARSA
jgi:hypothetical protein